MHFHFCKQFTFDNSIRHRKDTPEAQVFRADKQPTNIFFLLSILQLIKLGFGFNSILLETKTDDSFTRMYTRPKETSI